MTQRKKQYHPKIPDYELEAIARCLLPDMQSYFESDEGKRTFAEWQAVCTTHTAAVLRYTISSK